jgi:hypothetical protein
MTATYNCYYTTIWLLTTLIPLTMSVFGIWGLATQPSTPERWVGWILITLSAPILWILWRGHDVRVSVRSGSFPNFCTGDRFPSTEDELIAAVTQLTAGGTKPAPRIVGSGWGFFLYRRGPKGPRIFLHNYKGRQPKDIGDDRWRSGTTIMAFTQEMKKNRNLEGEADPLVLETYPTMDYISIGAWFAMGNHGNGGPASGRSADSLKNARMLNMETLEVDTVTYKAIRERFDAEQFKPNTPSKWCILDVAFTNLKKDRDLQKRGMILDPKTVEGRKNIDEWLGPRSYLRVIFQGAARDYAIGLVWTDVYDEENSHRDPHCCSRFCQYAQVDNCSVACGWHEPMNKFNGMITRFYANKWMPPIFPIEQVFVIVAGYRNFEIFWKPSRTLDGDYLRTLVAACIKLHADFGGRSEIRNGSPTGLMCLDVSLRGNFSAPFKMLKDELGVTECALHLGKWNNPLEISTRPLKRVWVSQLNPGGGGMPVPDY